MQYDAFISYAWEDEAFATRLKRLLETFRCPHLLGRKSRKLAVCLDRHDFAGNALPEVIKKSLESSQKLIILCSPNTAKSRWINLEIEWFMRSRTKSDLIPVFVPGDQASEPESPQFHPEELKAHISQPLLVNFQPKPAMGFWQRQQHRFEAKMQVIAQILGVTKRSLIRRYWAGFVLRAVAAALLLIFLGFIAAKWWASSRERGRLDRNDRRIQASRNAQSTDPLLAHLMLMDIEGDPPSDAVDLGNELLSNPTCKGRMPINCLPDSRFQAEECSWTHDGSSLLTIDRRGTVEVWSTHSCLPDQMLPADAPVEHACWTADQKGIVTAKGRKIQIWMSPRSSTPPLIEHGEEILWVRCLPTTPQILVGDKEGQTTLIDYSGKVLRKVGGNEFLHNPTFDPEGRRVLLWGFDEVYLLDLKSEDPPRLIAKDCVFADFMSADGRIIVVNRDGSVLVHSTGGQPQPLGSLGSLGSPPRGPIVFNRTQAYLLYSTKFGVEVRRVSAFQEVILSKPVSVVSQLAVSEDGQLVAATSSEGIRGWTLDGARSWTLKSPEGKVKTLRFLGAGIGMLSISEDGYARTWDLSRPTAAIKIVPGEIATRIYDWSTDSSRLFAVSDDGKGHIFSEVASGRSIEHREAFALPVGVRAEQGSMSWTARRAAILCNDDRVRVFDTDTRKIVAEWPGDSGVSWAAQIDDAGQRVITATDNVLQETDGARVTMWDALTGRRLREFPHAKMVTSLKLTEGGELLTTSDDGKVRIWGLSDDRPRLELSHPRPVLHAAMSADGQRLAVGSVAGSVRLWDLADGKGAFVDLACGTGRWVMPVTFDASGSYLGAICQGEPVCVWEIGREHRRTTLARHETPIESIRFLDGGRIATISADGVMRIRYHEWTVLRKALGDRTQTLLDPGIRRRYGIGR